MNTPPSFCPHAPVCSDCLLTTQISVVDRAALFFEGVEGYRLVCGRGSGWRTRAKLAVRRQRGEVHCGLFRRGSHEVVSIPRCVAHHPKINEALQVLSSLAPSQAYDERSGEGELRYVQLIVERSSGRVQLSFVLNLQNFESSQVCEWERWAQDLFSREPGRWHSFWLNLQPKPTNTIFGPQWKRICGELFVREQICGRTIPLLPSHFSQANPEMFELLLTDLLQLLPAGQKVVDLYGGMGVIGCVIAPKCRSVTIIERDEGSQEPFLEAKRFLPVGTDVSLVVGDVDRELDWLDGAATVVVDPPRKGLSASVLEALRRGQQISTLFYISCHFPTLERDVQKLKDAGFSVSWARSYLFFPGTDQIETLVRFSRERSG